MVLLTKPANKQKQMLTCSSFLLFPAIYLFKCCLVTSRAHWTQAEPSSFPSECLINVHTESTHKHPSSSKFPTQKEDSGTVWADTKKHPPLKSLLMSVQTAVKSLRGSLKIYSMPHVSHPDILLFLSTISNTPSVMAIICWSCFPHLLWRVGQAGHLQDLHPDLIFGQVSNHSRSSTGTNKLLHVLEMQSAFIPINCTLILKTRHPPSSSIFFLLH